jgi:uncharacterized protein (DUF1810 family)
MPLAPLQQQPVTTEYFKKLQEIKKMGLSNVKDQLIAQVLNHTEGNIKDAVAILRAAADSGQSSAGTSAAPGARGGLMLPIQERATIYDFLKAQDGILPPILGGGECHNYTQALYEINAGQKKTCWIWYIIPSSPGRSDISIFFGIGPNANRANVTPEQYLSNWKLSIRYIKILNAIGAKLQQSNPSNVKQFLVTLMGSEIDYDKLKKSLIIFSNALKNQHKVTPEIALLAEFLGVKLYAQPPGPPPGASAAHMSAAPMSAAPPQQYPPQQYPPQQYPPQQYPPQQYPPQQYPPQQYPPPSEETISKMMKNAEGEDLHTRQKVEFALEKTNNDVAQAIELLNPPYLQPQQVQEAYEATPDNLKNPETFVEHYVTVNNIPLLSIPLYDDDELGRNLNTFPQIFHTWRVKQTVGDGNCLTHAFLQCLSPIYGKITGDGYTNKSNVAQYFRLMFSSESGLARHKLDYEINKGLKDLSDLQILDYSRLFNVITVVFENQSGSGQTFISASNFTTDSKPTDKVIFIHGDGGHYSSVMLSNKQFIMSLAEAKQIQELQESLS